MTDQPSTPESEAPVDPALTPATPDQALPAAPETPPAAAAAPAGTAPPPETAAEPGPPGQDLTFVRDPNEHEAEFLARTRAQTPQSQSPTDIVPNRPNISMGQRLEEDVERAEEDLERVEEDEEEQQADEEQPEEQQP